MSPDNLELVKSAPLQGFKFDASDNNTQFLISSIWFLLLLPAGYLFLYK